MTTEAQQTIDIEKVTGPGAAAPATEQPASVIAAEKKARKPSKKAQALMDAAFERGVMHGLNTTKAQPSGLWVWLFAAAVVGFVIGARFG